MKWLRDRQHDDFTDKKGGPTAIAASDKQKKKSWASKIRNYYHHEKVN